MDDKATGKPGFGEIRTVGPDDARAFADVIRRSFRTVADEFGFTPENTPRFTAFAVTEERIRGEMADTRREMFACFDPSGQRMIGCCAVVFDGNGSCELCHLAVLPEYRHLRVGSALIREVCDRARAHGCGRMKLGMVEENTRLKRWYELAGFVTVRTEKYDFFPFTCGYMEKEL